MRTKITNLEAIVIEYEESDKRKREACENILKM
jgi:hypothetical protein